jgi:hypothetical protein
MDWKDHLRSFEKMRDSTHQPQQRIRQKSDPMGNFLGETKRSPSSNCYAKGGVVARNSPQNLTPRRARRLAHEGRGGDTRLAEIGPEVARMLDQLIHMGKTQRNPKTGLREYNPDSDSDLSDNESDGEQIEGIEGIEKLPTFEKRYLKKMQREFNATPEQTKKFFDTLMSKHYKILAPKPEDAAWGVPKKHINLDNVATQRGPSCAPNASYVSHKALQSQKKHKEYGYDADMESDIEDEEGNKTVQNIKNVDKDFLDHQWTEDNKLKREVYSGFKHRIEDYQKDDNLHKGLGSWVSYSTAHPRKGVIEQAKEENDSYHQQMPEGSLFNKNANYGPNIYLRNAGYNVQGSHLKEDLPEQMKRSFSQILPVPMTVNPHGAAHTIAGTALKDRRAWQEYERSKLAARESFLRELQDTDIEKEPRKFKEMDDRIMRPVMQKLKKNKQAAQYSVEKYPYSMKYYEPAYENGRKIRTRYIPKEPTETGEFELINPARGPENQASLTGEGLEIQVYPQYKLDPRYTYHFKDPKPL